MLDDDADESVIACSVQELVKMELTATTAMSMMEEMSTINKIFQNIFEFKHKFKKHVMSL